MHRIVSNINVKQVNNRWVIALYTLFTTSCPTYLEYMEDIISTWLIYPSLPQKQILFETNLPKI